MTEYSTLGRRGRDSLYLNTARWDSVEEGQPVPEYSTLGQRGRESLYLSTARWDSVEELSLIHI